MGFTRDDKLQGIATAFAQDAVDFLRDHFGITLDWSDESLVQLEAALARFHSELALAQPPAAKILQFSQMFGSYIGEVYRRNHGATWGMIDVSGRSVPGLMAEGSGTTFWPWLRARDRLVRGEEHSVSAYYTALKRTGPAA